MYPEKKRKHRTRYVPWTTNRTIQVSDWSGFQKLADWLNEWMDGRRNLHWPLNMVVLWWPLSWSWSHLTWLSVQVHSRKEIYHVIQLKKLRNFLFHLKCEYFCHNFSFFTQIFSIHTKGSFIKRFLYWNVNEVFAKKYRRF